jgi:hypothetical protein
MRSIHALALIAALAGTTLLTGCGDARENIASPAQNTTSQPKEVVYPDWVGDPGTNGQFGAVGISKTSLGGTAEEFPRALNAGRVELARSIQVKVQAAYTRFFTEGGELSQGANGGTDAKIAAQEMSENVSKTLTNQVLQGSRQKAVFRDPNTKELFMWVVIDEAKLPMLKQQIKDEANNQVAKRAQISAELKAQDALKRLDAAIDQEMTRQQAATK